MAIINLLNLQKQVPSNAERQTSVSMTNTIVGTCPKCQKSMSSALIINNEDVYYCESCRVCLPRQNIV